MTLFTIDEVRKTFKNGDVEEEILKGINLSLKEGEITALVGASGSGKSTLLTIAAGLQPATDGQILFEGHNLTAMNEEQVRGLRASKFGFVFQFAHLVPFLTVAEQLLLMLDVAGSPLKKHEKKHEVNRLLQLVGLAHRQHAYPSSLSGGEKQRVAIARAIIHQPKVLFADEPTASLDSQRSKEIMLLIRTLTKTLNITTLLVTHDEEMLAYTDRIIKMSDGVVL
ncbi:ABC transporter ATP-binding protein [Lysinibacillus fusiformis]|jgi:putative ABC transport system ATP-binding protein|uniref:ABC transporter ATP-binding protein n=1 Tax=Lysinibacillus TaxID=400634 RepID=UPI0004DB1403|nr:MULTISPECIES: ABC transporter ATP-binding protein [Lysinibacillus]AJK86426.1 hemin ABC transporter ATP-binding protein [Lysinibacillus fusiformis]KEK11675.1 hemin ABC transporter ATP-binding protein [Lysinibacillus sphaericus]KGA83422.1 hemin ABC transporter ATP-binding protein [Lysinibacillus fusiformis]KHK50149.1 hemin ABC transporter ATP-binding protein [Lysinibacillus sp. A1]MCK1989233.1 ABC transporter ATP-binding protein [Lysinibacillus fusiformis]